MTVALGCISSLFGGRFLAIDTRIWLANDIPIRPSLPAVAVGRDLDRLPRLRDLSRQHVVAPEWGPSSVSPSSALAHLHGVGLARGARACHSLKGLVVARQDFAETGSVQGEVLQLLRGGRTGVGLAVRTAGIFNP